MRRYKDQLYFIDTQVTKNKERCRYYDEFKNVAHFSIRYRNAAQRQETQHTQMITQDVFYAIRFKLHQAFNIELIVTYNFIFF
jgi:hypothetical protein